MSADAARKVSWSATCLVVAMTLCAAVPAVAVISPGGVAAPIVTAEFHREREQAALVDRLLDQLREAARQAVGPDARDLGWLAGALWVAGLVWAGAFGRAGWPGGRFLDPLILGAIQVSIGRPRIPRGGPPLHWLNRPPPGRN